jgi:hypothetical protein
MATYPLLPETVPASVTILEDIRCLLSAGRTWEGDRLVHPEDKEIWRMYKRVNSPRIGGSPRLDAEIEQAVREARWREQRARSGG